MQSENMDEISLGQPLPPTPPSEIDTHPPTPPPPLFVPCGVCNINVFEQDAEGKFVVPHESNESEGIESNCDCLFCVNCLEWMHRFHVTRCRSCNGNIHDLVVFRPCSHIEHSDSDLEDSEGHVHSDTDDPIVTASGLVFPRCAKCTLPFNQHDASDSEEADLSPNINPNDDGGRY